MEERKTGGGGVEVREEKRRRGGVEGSRADRRGKGERSRGKVREEEWRGRTNEKRQREDDVNGKRGGSKQTASGSSDGHQNGLKPRRWM